MGSALNSQPPPLPPGQEPLPQPPREIVLQPNGKQAAPPPPPERGVVDTVRDPNFNSLMQNQNYFNMLSQLVADRQARGEMPNLMPIGDRTQATGTQDFIDARQPGVSYTADMVNYIDPATGEKASRSRGIVPGPGSRFVPADRFQIPNQPIPTTGSTVPQANVPDVNQPAQPIPQMQQMQNYNQMLQRGMRRNQDMNQAAQNLAAPAGPVRSFSQMAGRTRRTPMPRFPANNSLAPSNQKLI